MQIGFNLLLWTTHVTDDLMPVIEGIKAAGYDGVEVPMFEGDPAHYAALRRRLGDIGLRATVVGVVPGPEANPIGDTAQIRQAGQDHLSWLVDCSAALGAEVLCGPFHSPLGVFSGTGPTPAELDRMRHAHQAMADHAQGTGVALSIEPLNRFECYALTTANASAAHVAAVDRPNFGYLYDTFHANIEETDTNAAIRATRSAINHVHISENNRGVPGQGHADIRGALKALKDTGYDGWLTVEAFGQALPALAAATKVWRTFFTHEDEVVEAGLRVIRDGWKG